MKGTKMMERKETCDCCECCHCKKMFMILVLMLLSFIAGIMVGNCRNASHINDSYLNLAQQGMQHLQARKHIRGMHEVKQPQKHTATVHKNTDTGVGGYIVEIDAE